MIKRISLLLLMVALLMPITGCKDSDEPIEVNRLESVDITYTFSISADALTYFNITAMYYNALGETVSKQMTEPVLVVTTAATKFPAQRQIWFTVTRTDVQPPVVSPDWTQSISIVAKKRYTLPGTSEQLSEQRSSRVLSPKPEYFGQWSEKYINDMATGYPVTIDANGNVTF